MSDSIGRVTALGTTPAVDRATAADASTTSANAAGAASTKAASTGKPTPDAHLEKLRHAASEFEAIFVKQLLKEAHMGGAQKSSGGYADMAVDAMANGVQHGGGLGLAKQIERALAASGALGPAGHAKASTHPVSGAAPASSPVSSPAIPVPSPSTSTPNLPPPGTLPPKR